MSSLPLRGDQSEMPLGKAPGTLPNDDLKWEKTSQIGPNVGVLALLSKLVYCFTPYSVGTRFERPICICLSLFNKSSPLYLSSTSW